MGEDLIMTAQGSLVSNNSAPKEVGEGSDQPSSSAIMQPPFSVRKKMEYIFCKLKGIKKC